MMPACKKFLRERLEELTLADGVTRPFVGDPGDPGDPAPTIFFQELPPDFLKDNDFGVCCLPLIDRNSKLGRMIAKRRDLEAKTLIMTRRRYRREIVFRCLMYGLPDELYGTEAAPGLVDRFIQGVAQFRVIAATDNSVITVNPQDGARPWDGKTETDRKLKRPALAIIRVEFVGGVQTTAEIPLVPSVSFDPQFQ